MFRLFSVCENTVTTLGGCHVSLKLPASLRPLGCLDHDQRTFIVDALFPLECNVWFLASFADTTLQNFVVYSP